MGNLAAHNFPMIVQCCILYCILYIILLLYNVVFRWCDDCTKDCPTLPESYAGLRFNNYKLLEVCRSSSSSSNMFFVLRHYPYSLFHTPQGHGEWCSSPLIVSCPPLTPYNNTTVMLFDLESDPEELVNIAG